MHDVLIHRAIGERHQIGIRYLGDRRNQIAGLDDHNLEAGRLQSQGGEISNFVERTASRRQHYFDALNFNHGLALRQIVCVEQKHDLRFDCHRLTPLRVQCASDLEWKRCANAGFVAGFGRGPVCNPGNDGILDLLPHEFSQRIRTVA